MSGGRRALHYVLKIGDRDASVKFYRDLLGMTALRHEEFDGMCEATCNGPYDNKWSKTMIGYGPEDNHFVLELTYNYTVGSYKLGNDLKGLTLSLPQPLFDRVKTADKDNLGHVQVATTLGPSTSNKGRISDGRLRSMYKYCVKICTTYKSHTSSLT